ncbi:MAG: hypothetical protein ATN35_02420 [Epulopiscium sp. Nele67-Bin004]|nr:MAG: hypothetical protein ATN35_02420 [Epulopiscium sp. Nele67-Bin004]
MLDLYIFFVSVSNINQQYISYTPKQRLRNMHIEYFGYDVNTFGKQGKNIQKVKRPMGVLFHYSYGAKQADKTILTSED